MKRLKGSITAEASFVIPMVIAVIGFIIMTGFCAHDRAVIRGALGEAGSMCAMMIRTGAGTGEADFDRLFNERIDNKLIVAVSPQISSSVNKVKVSADAKASVNIRAIPLIGMLLKNGQYKIDEKVEFSITDPEDNIRMTIKAMELIDKYIKDSPET